VPVVSVTLAAAGGWMDIRSGSQVGQGRGIRSAVDAFVIGAALGWPPVVIPDFGAGPGDLVLGLLCPGLFLAFPLLGLLGLGILSSEFFPTLLVAVVVINGAVYAMTWRLIRLAMRGNRPMAIPAVLIVGGWTACYAYFTVQNRSVPPPPPAPVDMTSPLVGRWEGLIYSERGNVPITLVLLPRKDGKLDGFESTDHKYVATFEEGTHSGDSLRYDVLGIHQIGGYDGDSLTLRSGTGATWQTWKLRSVSRDTGTAGLPESAPPR
jgi:hypothetical protein